MKRYSKILVLLMIFTLVLTITACELEKEELSKYVLVKEKIFNRNGKIKYTGDYEYNNQGQVTKIVYKNEAGEVIEHKEYKYSDKGLKVERRILKLVKNWSKYLLRMRGYDLRQSTEEIAYEDLYLNKGRSTYQYNNKDQLVYYEERNEYGEKVRWIDFEYHNNGEMKLKYIQHLDGNEDKYYFNKNGDWRKKVTYWKDGSKNIEESQFDSYGNRIRIEIKDINSKGKVIYTEGFKYKYDSNHNMIEFINYNKEDKYFFGGKLEYDEQGNIIKWSRTDDNREVVGIDKCRYDEQGNIIFYSAEDRNGKFVIKSKIANQYDKNGNIIKIQEISLSEDRKTGWKEYEYEKIK